MPQKAVKGKKGKKGGTPKKVAPPPKSKAMEVEEDSDDDEDDSEDEPVTKVEPKKSKKVKVAPPAEDSDSSEEDSDESDEAEMAKAVSKDADDDDDEDDDDEDDEDDDDDDDDDSDEEETKAPKPKATKEKPSKQAKMEVEDEDDSEDDDDDDDDDDDEDESEDNSDEEEEKPAVNGKRKKEQKEQVVKKQKVEETLSVFVGNVPKEMDDAKLKKLFVKKGVAVKEARKVPNKRFGYVDLENEADLEKALKLNGKKIGDNELKVEKAKPRTNDGSPKQKTPGKKDFNERKSGGGKDDSTLFVKNLSEDTTEESLKEFFTGSKEIRLPRKPDDSHKGFAYIVFDDPSEVEQALKDKQGSELDGNALYLDHAGSKRTFNSQGGGDRRKSVGEAGKTKVLFVKNLSFDTDEDGLKSAFDKATSARIAKYPDTQKPKGFGFVEFDNPEDAQAAMNSMKGAEIDGRQIFLDYAGERGSGGGGGGFRGGRGGFRGGRGGGFRGGRGGGFRGGRGDGRGRGGGRGGFKGNRGGIKTYEGSKKKFDD